MKNESTLKKYMNQRDRDALGQQPTTHSNCKAMTGRNRPGKTARDKKRNNND